MKLAFLIAAHAHPRLLARLVKRLQSPASSIYLHIDRGADIRPFKAAFREARISEVHWVARVRSAWGSFGQVRASLSLLRQALEGEPRADRFILLSGQDYPLVTPAKMIAFFQEKGETDFFTAHPLPWAEWTGAGGLDRLRRYHFFLGRYSFSYPSEAIPGSRLVRAACKACELLLPRERPLPGDIAFHGGSNWWNLTRRSAETVFGFLHRNASLVRRFRFTKSADEIFFQTALLHSSSRAAVENDDLRYVIWDGRRNESPATLRLEDFDEIAASGKLFARKMHPLYSLPVLDRIDDLLQ